jgi:hypothetical protein
MMTPGLLTALKGRMGDSSTSIRRNTENQEEPKQETNGL